MSTLTRCPACAHIGTHAGWCPDTYTPAEVLDNLGANYMGLRHETELARIALAVAIQDASAAGLNEVEIARHAGVDRGTVRKALGKPRGR